MTLAEISSDKAVRLLLLLSRTVFTDEERLLAGRECRSLQNWREFTELAIRNGVAALAWQNISDLSLAACVPEPERKTLEDIRFKTIARVSYITSVISEVVAALEEEGIKVLLLKGLALEHTVYGSRGLRQMSDADLLVSPEEVIRARDRLVKTGFVSDALKSRLYRHILLDTGNHLPMLRRGGMSIDLHHRLFGPEGAGLIKKAMQNPDTVTAAGREFYVPPPRTAFLGLVNHIFKHEIKGEFQLRLYTDIYLMTQKYREKIFNENLLPEAGEAGIMDELMIVLERLNKLYGLSFPELSGIITGSSSSRPEDVIMHVKDHGIIEPLSQKQVFQENLRSLKGLKRKLIFIAGDLFPSLSFMRERYGVRKTLPMIFFYLHRLGKLIWTLDALFTRRRLK
jgi:hypothetical protein